MPGRKDDQQKRGFLSRAFSSGRIKGLANPSSGAGGQQPGEELYVGAEVVPGAREAASRRLSSIAPLPPALAGDEAPVPPVPSLPSGLSLSGSVSSMASTSSNGGGDGVAKRRYSLYDPSNPHFPSPTRSREPSAASSSSSSKPPRPKSMHSSTSHSSLRPISTAFPSRPLSVHSSSSTAAASPSQQRRSSSSRQHHQPSSSSPPPPVPSHPSLRPSGSTVSFASSSSLDSHDHVSPSRRSGSLSSSSSGAEDNGVLFSRFGALNNGTGQMDQYVEGMRLARSRSKNGKGKGKEKEQKEELLPYVGGRKEDEIREEQRRRRRQHRREKSLEVGGWASSSGGEGGSAGGGESGGGRSRETSGFSDASFASMTAQAPPPIPVPIDEDDLTGAPSMERQETLKALERPWMKTLALGGAGAAGEAAGGAAGGARERRKSIADIVEQHKGQFREAAVGRGGRRLSYLPATGGGARDEGGPLRWEGGGEPPPLPPEKDWDRYGSTTPRQRSSKGASLYPPGHGDDSPPQPYTSFPPPSDSYSNGLTLLVPSALPPPVSPTSVGAVPSPPVPTPTRIKSIAEIMAEHAGKIQQASAAVVEGRRASLSAPPVVPPLTSNVPLPTASTSPVVGREREDSRGSLSSTVGTRDSSDSLGEEIRLAAKAAEAVEKQRERDAAEQAALSGGRTPRLVHSRSFTPSAPGSPSFRNGHGGDDDSRSVHSSRSASAPSARSGTPTTPVPRVSSPSPSPSSSHHPLTSLPSSSSATHDLAVLLRSPRLTRLFTLRTPPNNGLTVSLADVGSPSGHPVLVFLGLGSVRYLVALYDEIASELGLRLICVDRWGLGKTGEVKDEKRGFVEWASVVEEVVSPACLDLQRFSILAHSAGAPYAVAVATSPPSSGLYERVHGSLHLLAPWVSTPSGEAESLAGMYKLLKYVPSGVLKTAQAAEWKMTSWRLGKPPVMKVEAVGWDAKSGRMVGGAGGGGEEGAGRYEEREKWTAPTSPGLGGSEGGAARKVQELYGVDAQGVVVAGPAIGKGTSSSPASKGWKLLGGRRDKGSSSANGVGGEDGASSQRSSLRPPSILSKRASMYSTFSSSSSAAGANGSDSAASSRILGDNGLPLPSRRASVFSTSSSVATSLRSGSPSPTTPTRSDSLSSFSSALNPPSGGPLSTSTSSASLLTAAPPSSTSNIAPAALIDGLLRASHAESLRGGTADLLVLLERTSTPPPSTSSSSGISSSSPAPSSSSTSSSTGGKRGLGFTYRSLRNPLKIWYGDRDDRISLGSVRWLEREVNENGESRESGVGCEVRVVEGADHGLMANGKVMLEALESIASEWDTPSSQSLPVRRS
ncbi:hypothetical protein JCM8547_009170 [Rhodosporidiobolus lusitaniae]